MTRNRGYQPIGHIKYNKWTNFDIDYFNDFEQAKKFIERKSSDLIRDYFLDKIGLDVFAFDKEEYLPMFWEYKNGNWSRNYKD